MEEAQERLIRQNPINTRLRQSKARLRRLVEPNHGGQERIMVRHFTLEYWTDEGWYVGRLREVPGVFSQGVSLQELEENIQDSYQLMMECELIGRQLGLK